jgi:hypothetical protein
VEASVRAMLTKRTSFRIMAKTIWKLLEKYATVRQAYKQFKNLTKNVKFSISDYLGKPSFCL